MTTHQPGMTMYSRDETVNAVLGFYQAVLHHPYLDDDALIIPPPTGWDSITAPEGKKRGRTGPPPPSPLSPPNIQPRQENDPPLPAHCIRLTRSLDREATSLILDTDAGTVTEFRPPRHGVRCGELEGPPPHGARRGTVGGLDAAV
ncbi:hypothetical protein F5B20DRAFT_578821 [Whalleya microplaca]|nr:hypothetical protein F5B20DRAFT_578821 [Whalleya microplaca]